MDENYERFMQADLSDYDGEYAAIARKQVVAHGDAPGYVYEEGKKRFPGEKVVLWKVMKQGCYVKILAGVRLEFRHLYAARSQ